MLSCFILPGVWTIPLSRISVLYILLTRLSLGSRLLSDWLLWYRSTGVQLTLIWLNDRPKGQECDTGNLDMSQRSHKVFPLCGYGGGTGGKPGILVYRAWFYLHFRHLLGDTIDIYSVTDGRHIENIKNIPQYSGLRSCRFSYVVEP